MRFHRGQIAKDGGATQDPIRLGNIPSGFMGTSEDITAAVGYLASAEAR